MDRSLINDYLRRSGMEAPQAEVLSQILGQMATRADVRLLEDRLQSIQDQMNRRFGSADEKLETRLLAMEEKLDTRLLAMEDRLTAGLQDAAGKLAALESRLTWRLVALMGGFAAIVTLLDRLPL